MEPRLSQTREITSHTAIRGIAALLVVAYHFQFSTYLLPVETALPMLKRGYVFVDLFFVLSGFIISYVNAAEKPHVINQDFVIRFIKKRLIRLYPLMLFCLGYLLVFRVAVDIIFYLTGRNLIFAWTPESIAILIGQLTLTNAWLPFAPDWNIPSWSISAEMFAYLLFPLLLLTYRRSQALFFASAALIITGFYIWAVGHGTLDIISLQAPWRCVAGFLLGMIIYLMRASVDRLSVSLLTTIQLGAVAAIIAVLNLPVNDVAVIPAFVLLVLTTWTDRGVLGAVLRLPMFAWLGRHSYSIYLNHVPVIAIFWFVWIRTAPSLPLPLDIARVLWIVIAMAAVLLVSAWTYARVELPAQRALTRRFLSPAPSRTLA